jgi:hypothetical protein
MAMVAVEADGVTLAAGAPPLLLRLGERIREGEAEAAADRDAVTVPEAAAEDVEDAEFVCAWLDDCVWLADRAWLVDCVWLAESNWVEEDDCVVDGERLPEGDWVCEGDDVSEVRCELVTVSVDDWDCDGDNEVVWLRVREFENELHKFVGYGVPTNIEFWYGSTNDAIAPTADMTMLWLWPWTYVVTDQLLQHGAPGEPPVQHAALDIA